MPESDTNDIDLRCWRCGASLSALSPPLSRRDLCPGCGVEVHVCRMCKQYAPAKPDACAEEDAIAVRDKTAANFCDYFVPSQHAFDGRDQRGEVGAKARLAALFGEEPAPSAGAGAEDAALSEAEKLFRK